jgi:hypothetical protein
MAPLSYYSHIFHIYLSCFRKKQQRPAGQKSGTGSLELHDFQDQGVEFMIANL